MQWSLKGLGLRGSITRLLRALVLIISSGSLEGFVPSWRVVAFFRDSKVSKKSSTRRG